MKKIKLNLILILVIALLLTGKRIKLTASLISEDIYISESYDEELKKHVKKPDIDDNFKDDEVLVILNYVYSKPNGAVNLSEFNSIGKPQKFNEIKDKSRIKDTSYITRDEKQFRQILSLKLSNPGKENVIKAVNELNKHKKVLVASPVYIYEAINLWEPTDNLYNQQ